MNTGRSDNDQDAIFGIATLIAARMSGTISDRQEEQLARWCAESPENEQLYSKITDGRRFMLYVRESGMYDYERNFAKLKTRMDAKKAYRSRLARRVSAAVAAALIVAAVLVFMTRHSDDTDIVADATLIAPGSARAQLTLGNGLTIELGDQRQPIGIAPNIHVDSDTLSYSAAAAEGMPVESHLITIPRGGEYFMKLSDGTRVWLNSETALRYPSSFGRGERRVQLEGEAYFEVEHDPKLPFVVETAQQQVSVLGTSFSVRAYADQSVTVTTLESGRVAVDYGGDFDAILDPGRQATLADGKITVRDVDTSIYTAWRNGKFIFIDQPLGEILLTLGRWYDLDVVYTNPGLEDLRFTGELERYSSIGELLVIFETLEKVRFGINGHTVTVTPY